MIQVKFFLQILYTIAKLLQTKSIIFNYINININI